MMNLIEQTEGHSNVREHVECIMFILMKSSLLIKMGGVSCTSSLSNIRHFYPQADTLRLHLTLTLWVQCIVHLRSNF